MKMRWLEPVPLLALLVAYGCGALLPVESGPATVEASRSPAEAPIPLPNAEDSFRFVVLGDFGTGGTRQYEVAAEMARFRESFAFDVVVTVGDNLYGAEKSRDFQKKFETPYKPLLDAGVTFYATLGNHDSREQRFYELFNMNGDYYYTFKAPDRPVRFFMIDSTYRTPEEFVWLEKELQGADDDWKIAVFHHPLYSSGGRHGSDKDLRRILEPLFVTYNVSVAFSGHDHFYERLEPQLGVVYFVVGSGGKLAPGDIDRRSGLTARGYDRDNVFLAVEIAGDRMYFNAVTRGGHIVDSGIIERRLPAVAATESAPGGVSAPE
ncbi:MAG: metallophosphoesterase [Candidatus Krumholzibacteriia bacterium]